MSSVRDGLLLGMGNPLLDISAVVDEAFLKKYDLLPDNAILADEKHKPMYSELVENYNAEFIAGGSVQNTLRVTEWILERGNVAVFFGCVGEDKYAKILEERAHAAGLNVQFQYTKDAPTGTCGVLITGHHRSLCANLAAANHFTIDHLQRPENEKLLQNAEYFYVSGFFLTVSPPSIQAVAKHALENNKMFIFNLSAPFLSQFFKGPLMEAIPYVDILFGNETEAETFAEEQNFGTCDVREIARRMAELPKVNRKRQRVVVITQGARPVLVVENGELHEFPVQKLDMAEVVDTNGAGDAFVGGFMSQLVLKKPLEVCVKCGIWAAQKIIRNSGCTFDGKPDFDL
uniref:Adenosine kinase n=1 Tax=Phlebotomus kandelakii TaxID=1109342 RepID=A0A6B2EI10_9DIPT